VRTHCVCLVVLAALTSIAHARKAKATEKEPPPVAVEEPLVPGVLDPNKIRTLTNDPVLGKADRIDGDEATGVVAFTFDDGPNPETTPAVIDALEKYNIPATFFIVTRRLVGKQGEKPREILARQLKAGFLIGSHSVSHPNLKKADAKKLDQEVDASLRTLAPTAERPIGMFRPPFGAFGPAGKARLKKLGLTDVRWSVDTLDWKAKNADKLRHKVFSMILKQRGGVVLMHDVKPITAKIIESVFDDLEAENCRRLAAKQEPILPVSLHYFLKDGKTARAIPDAVKQRTEAYRIALPVRCAARPPLPPPPPPPAPVNPPPVAPTAK
jgi:peptidoglycan/xylan/chitin deacetylase (PgdA/CDA1 family)